MNLVAKLQGQKKDHRAALNTYEEMEMLLQTPSRVSEVEKERLNLFETEKDNLLCNKANQLQVNTLNLTGGELSYCFE